MVNLYFYNTRLLAYRLVYLKQWAGNKKKCTVGKKTFNF